MSDAVPPEFLAQLGNNIAEARRKARLRQNVVADRAGLGREYLSGIENGRRNPSVYTLARIARALRTSPSALLRGVAAPAPQQ